MTLEIVSPEQRLFKGEVTSVTLPGVVGSFQILNHHAPIVSTLKEGLIKIVGSDVQIAKDAIGMFVEVNPETYTLAIASGTIEMKDNHIIVLVD